MSTMAHWTLARTANSRLQNHLLIVKNVKQNKSDQESLSGLDQFVGNNIFLPCGAQGGGVWIAFKSNLLSQTNKKRALIS